MAQAGGLGADDEVGIDRLELQPAVGAGARFDLLIWSVRTITTLVPRPSDE